MCFFSLCLTNHFSLAMMLGKDSGSSDEESELEDEELEDLD